MRASTKRARSEGLFGQQGVECSAEGLKCFFGFAAFGRTALRRGGCFLAAAPGSECHAEAHPRNVPFRGVLAELGDKRGVVDLMQVIRRAGEGLDGLGHGGHGGLVGCVVQGFELRQAHNKRSVWIEGGARQEGPGTLAAQKLGAGLKLGVIEVLPACLDTAFNAGQELLEMFGTRWRSFVVIAAKGRDWG